MFDHFILYTYFEVLLLHKSYEFWIPAAVPRLHRVTGGSNIAESSKMARDKFGKRPVGHQWLVSRMTARMTGVVIRAGERARHAVWLRVRNLMVVVGEVVLCPTLLGTARLYFSMSCFR